MSKKNSKIKIYATTYMGRNAYAIRHIENKWTAYINRDKELLGALQAKLRAVTLGFEPSKQVFRFEHDRISIENFVYTFYNGEHDARVKRIVPPDEKRRRINCFRDNLYCESDIVPDNDSRDFQIAEDGKTFTLHLKQQDLTNRLTYSDEFWQFITKPTNFSFKVRDDRIVVHWHLGKKQEYCELSTLCYAFENAGITEANFRSSLAKFRDNLRDRDLTIDHMDTDHSNQCVWNLSCVTRGQNARKTDRTTWIKPPYFLYGAVTKSGEYLLSVGCGLDENTNPFHAKPFTWWKYYRCPTIEDLIHFLSELMKLDKRLWGAKDGETIAAQWAADKKGRYAAQDFKRKQAEVENLLSFPDGKPEIFTVKSPLEVHPLTRVQKK